MTTTTTYAVQDGHGTTLSDGYTEWAAAAKRAQSHADESGLACSVYVSTGHDDDGDEWVIEPTALRYALCSDVTTGHATVRILAGDHDDLCLTSAELAAAGLDDTAQILVVDADVVVGQRIHL